MSLLLKTLDVMARNGMTQDDVGFIIVSQGSMQASWSMFIASAVSVYSDEVDTELCIVGKERWWMDRVVNAKGIPLWSFCVGVWGNDANMPICNTLSRSMILTQTHKHKKHKHKHKTTFFVKSEIQMSELN
jgi:hypothetical protein